MGRKQYYDPALIVDAPEHNDRARASGVLTWGTWHHDRRPVEDRVQDFVDAYPPEDPVRHCGGSLRKRKNGEYAPGSRRSRLERFRADDWKPGSLHALLANFGLKLEGGPEPVARTQEFAAFRTIARRRNMKLRVLHGEIDASPGDMDVAKAEYLDRRERQQAAREIRSARKRMRADLKKKG